MSPVRYWRARRLAAAWLAAPVACLGVRWLLESGVYDARLEEDGVTIESGLWSAGFADVASWVVAGGVLATLLGLTAVWFDGATERRRLANTTEDPDRRPLL